MRIFSLNGESPLRSDGYHLGRIRRRFQDLSVDPGRRFDCDLVILAFTNRSGSTYLGQLLASTPVFHGFREDLNHDVVASRCETSGAATLTEYMDHIVGLQRGPNSRAFGLKASGEQIRIIRLAGIDTMFRRVTVLRMRRRDRIEQAISLWIAQRTGQWASHQPAQAVSLPYDFVQLRDTLEGINEAENSIDLILSALRYPVCDVFYEDLVAGTEGTMRRLLGCLGVDYQDFGAMKSSLEKQASPEKTIMAKRFREELAQVWSIHPI